MVGTDVTVSPSLIVLQALLGREITVLHSSVEIEYRIIKVTAPHQGIIKDILIAEKKILERMIPLGEHRFPPVWIPHSLNKSFIIFVKRYPICNDDGKPFMHPFGPRKHNIRHE
jgi:hypothetical protein